MEQARLSMPAQTDVPSGDPRRGASAPSEPTDQAVPPSQRARSLGSNGESAMQAYAVAELQAPPRCPTVEMERVQVTDPRMRPTLPAVRRAALPPAAPRPTAAELATTAPSWSPLWALLGVAVLALLAVGGYVASRRPTSQQPASTGDPARPGSTQVALVPDPVAAATEGAPPRDPRPSAAMAASVKARPGAPATTTDPISASPRPVPVTSPPAPSSHRIFGVED
jgi:hypothetical protein